MFIDQSEIHLWSLPLEEAPTESDTSPDLLSRDENERASRYHHTADALRFITSRVWLRMLLEGYTGIRAKDIAFSYGAYGKPELPSAGSCPDIRFSVSHTSGLTLFAFVLGRKIGVDIESREQQIDFREACTGVLGAAEIAHLNEIPPDQRESQFYTYWTRKEACLKMLGIGLSGEPETIDVSDPAAVRIKGVSRSGRQPEDKRVWLTDLLLEGSYSGACALEGSVPPRKVYHFRCDREGYPHASAILAVLETRAT
jgi:4'-phosphopantetheinyl transferase